jgi:hypothetical protein
MHSIENLVGNVGAPAVVGGTLAVVLGTNREVSEWILAQKGNLDLSSPIGQAIRGLMYGLGSARAEVVQNVTDAALSAWSIDELTEFYLVCPSDGVTWLQMERAGPEVQAAYWKRVHPMATGSSTPEELNEIGLRLIAAKRPRSAFLATEVFMEKIDPRLLHRMLDEMRTVPEEGARVLEQWHVAEAFDRLETAGILDLKELALLEFAFSSALEYSERGLKSLNRLVTKDATVFIELLSVVYKPKNALEKVEVAAHEREFASAAWTVLHNIKLLPGQRDDGTVDIEVMLDWVRTARKLAKEADRQEVGDYTIGEILSRAGGGADEIWPREGVRDVLELDDAEDIRRGFTLGTFNGRGVTSRAYDEGGAQERELARKYQRYGAELIVAYPRVAAMIADIQLRYEEDALREDLDAKLRVEGS